MNVKGNYGNAKFMTCPECGEETRGMPCTSCGAVLPSPGGAAATRDETADDRDRAADRRDRKATDRDAVARRQDQTATDHERAASEQIQSWSDDDQVASNSDQLSADEDQRAAEVDLAAGGDFVTFTRGAKARAWSRGKRGSASTLRDDTKAARSYDETDVAREEALLQGEHDRAEAAGDRAEAAGDRAEAAQDRADALFDTHESALAARRAIETLESMSDAFVSLDSEWVFTYLNPQAEVLVDRDRRGLVGKNLWEEFPELVGSTLDIEYRRATREQVPVRFEIFLQRLDRTLEVRAYPVVEGLAVYFTDVTEERLRDDRLRQAERLEMLGQMTAGIVHDFTNLFVATGGFAAMGQADAPDEKIARYFDAIAAANQKAQALTRQLLAFARQQELSPGLMDANEVVLGLSSLLYQLMPSDIDLRLLLAPQGVDVFVDRSQLEQVVLNLVVNSRDAIQGKGSITIKTAVEDPPGINHDLGGPCGWLQVIDTGAGIPEHIQPRIFDPFFTTKAPGEGTGLGLATIYGIVTQSGGSIFVDSQVGEGTSMTIGLPATPTSSSNAKRG